MNRHVILSLVIIFFFLNQKITINLFAVSGYASPTLNICQETAHANNEAGLLIAQRMLNNASTSIGGLENNNNQQAQELVESQEPRAEPEPPSSHSPEGEIIFLVCYSKL